MRERERERKRDGERDRGWGWERGREREREIERQSERENEIGEVYERYFGSKLKYIKVNLSVHQSIDLMYNFWNVDLG